MFTNGMSESSSSEVFLSDVSPEAFKVMLEFLYSGVLSLEDSVEFGTLLLQVLLLADQFGVTHLYQECCKTLLECLSEVAKPYITNNLIQKIFVESYLCFVDTVCFLLTRIKRRKSGLRFRASENKRSDPFMTLN
jgi:hypothetical protein